MICLIKMLIKNIYALLIYIFINAIFIYKYGIRQTYTPTYIILFIYPLLIVGLLLILNKIKKYINNLKNFKLFFGGFGVIISILLFVIIITVNKNELHTDRWSAMTVAINALLHLEYPYTAIDHLGGRSSNLPGLLLIGIPFYLLGKVGLLQLFVFISSLFYLIKSTITNAQKILILLLLLLSPAYLWEVYVSSDLMSNLIIVILFMIFWDFKYPKNYLEKPVSLGLLLSVLILTRGVVVIPLTIFLFYSFYISKKRDKIKLITTFLVGIIALVLSIIVLSPNVYTLLNYNPLELQTRQTSKSLQLGIISLSFVLSFKSKNIIQAFFWSFITLSMLLLLTMLGYFFKYGIYDSIIKNIFDISYLNIILPFAILSIVLNGFQHEKRSISI